MKLNENRGITLVALIVTIIILIILAGISIGVLTGENGLINQANNAKTQTEIAEETETVELAVTRAMRKDRYGNIDKENLDEELSENIGTKNYTSKEIEEGIAVTFTKSNRSYLVDIDGNVTQYILREPEPTPEDSTVATLETMLYGVIEVEFLNEKGYEIEVANEPILKDGMKSVYWAKDASGDLDLNNPANNTYEITSEDKNFKEDNWYQYTAQIAGADGKTSRWANAMTVDGSYYVWIPRYSYRIVYFNSQTNEDAYRAGTLTEEDALADGKIVGYSDARGIVDSSGKRPTSVTSTTSISVNDKYLRTHPVFDGNVDEGGWDSKLAGIWVMKYEASAGGATATSVGSGTIPKSVPNVKSWTGINVSTMFTYAKNAYATLNSHMMKNSEWGAVAYLADSKYGRNGIEMSVNQCSDYITGLGRGLNQSENNEIEETSNIYNNTYAWTEVDVKQKYDGIVGQLSSTTGNIYGIYDMSGSAWDYVMGFFKKNEDEIYIGSSIYYNSGFNGYLNGGTKKEDGIEFPNEKKYYQVYENTVADVHGNKNVGSLGDATAKETQYWNGDWGNNIYNGYPICRRGGTTSYTKESGLFSFYAANGAANKDNGFRVCLAIK